MRNSKRSVPLSTVEHAPVVSAAASTGVEALARIAASVGAADLAKSLPAALQSLANEVHAEQCVVARLVGDHLQRVARAHAKAFPRDRGHERRIPIDVAGRTIGLLILRSLEPLDAGSEQLLRIAAGLLAPALLGAERERRTEIDHEFTQQVLDSLPLGMHVVDRDYRVRAWNRKREDGMQGVRRDDALGRSIFEVLNRQSEDVLRREFDAVFETGEILRYEIESGPEPAARVFRVSKIPMRDANGVVTHVITIGEDVTDATRAQEEAAQARKLAAVGTLAAGAMHEINNPLATISACAETLTLQLADASMPDDTRATFMELCGIIDHEVHRSKRILNGLLDFSRPTGATRAPAELHDILEQTMRLLRYHPTFRSMQVEADISMSSRLMIRADRDQLVQVLMALMLNAMDAMNQAGIIRLRAFRSQVRGEEVVMEVIDQGVGIAPSVRQRLFEPFFTTKQPGRGTGLGLSICYGIVSDHGGRIEVESAVGKGSTFRVILPLAEPA